MIFKLNLNTVPPKGEFRNDTLKITIRYSCPKRKIQTPRVILIVVTERTHVQVELLAWLVGQLKQNAYIRHIELIPCRYISIQKQYSSV